MPSAWMVGCQGGRSNLLCSDLGGSCGDSLAYLRPDPERSIEAV